ncbi:phage antirepressor protein [Streptococcus pneumoniae]|nr:phage antirepressor protein [Streptococcus pneumoniae]
MKQGGYGAYMSLFVMGVFDIMFSPPQFTEGQDFLPNLGKSTGGRQATDHIIKLDMAKEIAMIQWESSKKPHRCNGGAF